MPRACRLLSLAVGLYLLFVSLALAQPGPDSIPVTVSSPDFSFPDLYQFRAPATTSVLPSGVLKTGGITAQALVTQRIGKQVSYQVEKIVYRVVNGRLVSERVIVTEYKTVYETVYRNIEIELPAASGTWYAINGPAYAVWVISSVSPSGVVVGFGTREASQVHGMITIVSLPTSPIPSGTYHVESPATME